MTRRSLICLILLPSALSAQSIRILHNHVGYEDSLPKHAVIETEQKLPLSLFEVVNEGGAVVFHGKPIYRGRVDHWKNWVFWTLDFSPVTREGTYTIVVPTGGCPVRSYPFVIGKNVLEQNTLSSLTYYFKGQRCTGLFDQADHHLQLAGQHSPTVDARGGWYDATGDYGKHLSHLSFSTYFNPQQISFTVWSLLTAYLEFVRRPGTDFLQYDRRLLDEGLYGADYLVRLQVPGGSFYRSVEAPGPGKLAKDRMIATEGRFQIRQSNTQGLGGGPTLDTAWRGYQVSFRSGGGFAIAALALAARFDTSGEFTAGDYLRAAESAFAFLQAQNPSMTNNGIENIVDDYCALAAATELYRTTGKASYKDAADQRADRLLHRLRGKGPGVWADYWVADDGDRPFFHAADAGLPIVSLLTYYPIASPDMQARIREAVQRSLRHEMAVTHEVTNPFGYARQLVQDTTGNRHTAFFFPHKAETAPWWQGEDARLASLATAARMGIQLFPEDKPFRDSLESYALDQLNWILGLNPYDACMQQGTGHNNPQYGFFGSFEYTSAPGGIVNGITSGLDDEDGIDFNVPYKVTGKDYDWRWAEQWLPHASWYLLALGAAG